MANRKDKPSFGIELGDELGFLPFKKKSELIHRIEALGGSITPIVNDQTSFLLSRGVSTEEFRGSLSLQHAIKCAVPIVTEDFLTFCEEHNGMKLASEPLDKHVVGISGEVLEEFLSATSYRKLPDGSTIAATASVSDCEAEAVTKDQLSFEDYDEGHPPSGSPAFQSYVVSRLHVFDLSGGLEGVLELQTVVLEKKGRERYNDALGEGRAGDDDAPGISSDDDDSHSADTTYPFRVMWTEEKKQPLRSGATMPSATSCNAKFFRNSFEAEQYYAELHMKHHSTVSYKCVSRIGSIEALRMAAESPLVHANQAKVPEDLKHFAATLYREAFIQMGEDGARKAERLNLLELSRAEAALIHVSTILCRLAKNKGNDESEAAEQLEKKTVQSELQVHCKTFFSVVPMTPKLKELFGPTRSYCRSLEELELMEDACRCLRTVLSCGEWAKGSIFAAPPFAQYCALGNSVNRITDKSALIALEEKINKNQEGTGFVGDVNIPSEGSASSSRVKITQAYSLRREEEQWNYNAKKSIVGNERILFHGSRMGNWVSILQAGLRVPLISRLRRDRGMLGRGVYFGDDIRTAAKYASSSSSNQHANNKKDRVFVLVCSVLLGNIADCTRHQYELTSPPPGFQSVHGVRSVGNATDFSEDEFVIYDASQQRMEYLLEVEVEECLPPLLPADKSIMISKSIPAASPLDFTHSSSADNDDAGGGVVSIKMDFDSPVEAFKDPKVKEQQVGLLGSGETKVPLKRTHVKAQVIDLIGEVNVYQQYRNDGNESIEAKYVFPLQGGCAVCGFEAYINNKKIVGRVKEKEEARKEYKAAVEKGHGAYLMDESEETPDVFTVSVGNLPPKCDVVIRITYVLELRVNAAHNAIEFIIPSNVHPAVRDREEKTVTQSSTRTATSHAAEVGEVQLDVGLDMPFDIEDIQCSHTMSTKRTACRAMLRTSNLVFLPRAGGEGGTNSSQPSALLEDFVMYVRLSHMSVPRIWVEEDPSDSYSKAAMITFFPEIEETPKQAADGSQSSKKRKEILFCIDCSASMGNGDAMEDAKQATILMLKELPQHWGFNIVAFGSFPSYIFPKSVEASMDSIEKACAVIGALCPGMGGTDVMSLIRCMGTFLAAHSFVSNGEDGEKASTRLVDMIIVSDGQLADEWMLNNAVSAFTNIRIFSVSVGTASNPTILQGLASNGRGCCEVLPHSQKSKWRYALGKQIDRASHEALTNIKVEWSTELSARLRERVNSTVRQSPQNLTSLFNGESTIIYGMVRHQARQCEVVAQRCGADSSLDQYGYWPEQRFLVTVHGMSFRTGNLIHRLAAKAQIREWVEGVIDPSSTSNNEAKKSASKKQIIDIGCHFGLVTPFTSMIAVEERSEEEQKRLKSGKVGECTTPSVEEIVGKAQRGGVDPIPEVAWDHELDNTEQWVRPIGRVTAAQQHHKQVKHDSHGRRKKKKSDFDEEGDEKVLVKKGDSATEPAVYQTLTERDSVRRRQYFPYLAKYATKFNEDCERDLCWRKKLLDETASRTQLLTPTVAQTLKEQFVAHDREYTGFIPAKELRDVLSLDVDSAGEYYYPTGPEIETMVGRTLEKDMGQQISFTEVLNLMERRAKELMAEQQAEEGGAIPEEITRVFSIFAIPGTQGDVVPAGHLKEIMCQLGEEMKDREVRKLVKKSSTDGGRTVSLKAMMRAGEDLSSSSDSSSSSEETLSEVTGGIFSRRRDICASEEDEEEYGSEDYSSDDFEDVDEGDDVCGDLFDDSDGSDYDDSSRSEEGRRRRKNRKEMKRDSRSTPTPAASAAWAYEPEEDEDEDDENFDLGGGLFDEKVPTSQMKLEADRSLASVEKDVLEFGEMASELSEMIHEQGASVDAIQTNVAESAAPRSKLQRIQKELEETKQYMQQNIEKVVERGESLENLVNKSDTLGFEAFSFKKQAKEVLPMKRKPVARTTAEVSAASQPQRKREEEAVSVRLCDTRSDEVVRPKPSSSKSKFSGFHSFTAAAPSLPPPPPPASAPMAGGAPPPPPAQPIMVDSRGPPPAGRGRGRGAASLSLGGGPRAPPPQVASHQPMSLAKGMNVCSVKKRRTAALETLAVEKMEYEQEEIELRKMQEEEFSRAAEEASFMQTELQDLQQQQQQQVTAVADDYRIRAEELETREQPKSLTELSGKLSARRRSLMKEAPQERFHAKAEAMMMVMADEDEVCGMEAAAGNNNNNNNRISSNTITQDLKRKKKKPKMAAPPLPPGAEPSVPPQETGRGGGFGSAAVAGAGLFSAASAVAPPPTTGFGAGGGGGFGSATVGFGAASSSQSRRPITSEFYGSGGFTYAPEISGPGVVDVVDNEEEEEAMEGGFPFVICIDAGIPAHLTSLPFCNMVKEFVEYSPASLALCTGRGKAMFHEQSDFFAAVIVSETNFGWKLSSPSEYERSRPHRKGTVCSNTPSSVELVDAAVDFFEQQVKKQCVLLAKKILDTQTLTVDDVRLWCTLFDQTWGLSSGASILSVLEIFTPLHLLLHSHLSSSSTDSSSGRCSTSEELQDEKQRRHFPLFVQSLLLLAASIPGLIETSRTSEAAVFEPEARKLSLIVDAIYNSLERRGLMVEKLLEVDTVAEPFFAHVHKLFTQHSSNFSPKFGQMFPFCVLPVSNAHGGSSALSTSSVRVGPPQVSYVAPHIDPYDSAARNYYEDEVAVCSASSLTETTSEISGFSF